jgi:small-conductance mechanosensitive channel
LDFGEDALNIELRFVVDFGQGLSTRDQVQMSIDHAFRQKGIEFALPKREITMVQSSAPESEQGPDRG